MISPSNEQLQQQLQYILLKPDYHSGWILKTQSGCGEERYEKKFYFKLWKHATETYRKLQIAFGPSCMNRTSVFEWHKRFKGGRESVRDDERCGRRKKVKNQSWLAKGLGLWLLCWGFKGVQAEILSERGQHSSNQVSVISSRTMHQFTTPSLSQTIWLRWASRQFLSPS